MAMTETPNPFPQFHVGDRLRKARETTAMDRKTFAEHIGIAAGTLRAYEEGRTPPKRTAVQSWAIATGFTVEQILGSDETPDGPTGGNVVDLRRVREQARTASTWMPTLAAAA